MRGNACRFMLWPVRQVLARHKKKEFVIYPPINSVEAASDILYRVSFYLREHRVYYASSGNLPIGRPQYFARDFALNPNLVRVPPQTLIRKIAGLRNVLLTQFLGSDPKTAKGQSKIWGGLISLLSVGHAIQDRSLLSWVRTRLLLGLSERLPIEPDDAMAFDAASRERFGLSLKVAVRLLGALLLLAQHYPNCSVPAVFLNAPNPHRLIRELRTFLPAVSCAAPAAVSLMPASRSRTASWRGMAPTFPETPLRV